MPRGKKEAHLEKERHKRTFLKLREAGKELNDKNIELNQIKASLSRAKEEVKKAKEDPEVARREVEDTRKEVKEAKRSTELVQGQLGGSQAENHHLLEELHDRLAQAVEAFKESLEYADLCYTGMTDLKECLIKQHFEAVVFNWSTLIVKPKHGVA